MSTTLQVYGLDCEMVYTVWGVEVARISLVNEHNEHALDVFVQPTNRLIDCNTRFSGITPAMIGAGACTFEQARQRMFELVDADTILIGHSLESDLCALRLVHDKVSSERRASHTHVHV